MTLLLIGATGHVGAAILTEAAATSFHTPSAGEIFIVQKVWFIGRGQTARQRCF